MLLDINIIARQLPIVTTITISISVSILAFIPLIATYTPSIPLIDSQISLDV
jgi:hypothetical protein